MEKYSQGAVPSSSQGGGKQQQNMSPDHDSMDDGYGMNIDDSMQQTMREDVYNPVLDKQVVQSALKDLKNNYKQIEMDIERTTKKQKQQHHDRY